MPFPDISPIAIQLGPIAVRWYALAYLAGVFAGAWYATTLLRRKDLWANDHPPFEPAAIWDFAFWAVIGIVLGGRIGYVLFYNLPYYSAHPNEIIALWDGGMSFHGGLVGIIAAMWLFTRSKGGRLLHGLGVLDAIGSIGLFLGRLANFVNGELYGAPTSLPWAVIFPTDPEALPRHPSQLYEAGLEGLLLFAVLWFFFWRTKARYEPGKLVGIFLLGYGCFRFFVEYFREPDQQFDGTFFANIIHMGQVLCLPMIIGGIYLIVTAKGRRQRVEPTLGTESVA